LVFSIFGCAFKVGSASTEPANAKLLAKRLRDK
jgi:hypothetical protein